MSTPLTIALGYIRKGWNPVPVPYRSKNPASDGWQNRIISVDDAPRHFDGVQQNIGVQLGPHSRGLTDVDCDCPEAIAIAPYVLPATRAIFGRPSTPQAHRLYYTDLSVSASVAVFNFNDPKTKKRLIEIRHGGGNKGCQTIFPGSTHADSGELIRWDDDGSPPSVDGDELHRKVRQLAALVLLARYWPRGKSSRHDYALTVGGFLARAGFDAPHVKLAVGAVARAAGDEEVSDRQRAAEDAAIALQRGISNVYGYPKLEELYGPEVAKAVADWLGYSSELRVEVEPRSVCAARTSLVSSVASSYQMVAVRWLWQDRFALGKIGLIAGLPDEGKGQTLAHIAAVVTNGGKWPMGEGHAPQGNVIVFSDEDDPRDTLVPRFAAAGADLDRIHIIKMAVEDTKDRLFNLATDLEALREKIAEVGDVRLILIDPVSSYLGVGKIDGYRTTDVRAVLTPLATLAQDCNVSIIGVLHFNKKVDVTNALLRISDSLAFGAVARHVYGVVDDTENNRKLFVRAKNNVAGKNQTLAYRFGLHEVARDPETGEPIHASFILWEDSYVDVTAMEAMQAAADNKSPGQRDAAKRLLLEMLADGRVLQTEISEAAEANGISARTLYRAKEELGVVAVKDRTANGHWYWELPKVPQ
jgi:hypothetical protein